MGRYPPWNYRCMLISTAIWQTLIANAFRENIMPKLILTQESLRNMSSIAQNVIGIFSLQQIKKQTSFFNKATGYSRQHIHQYGCSSVYISYRAHFLCAAHVSCFVDCREALQEPRDSNVGILENKSTLLTISRLWRHCGPSNYRFNFLLYWYSPWVFLWGRQCAFVFPIYVRKYRK